MDQSSGWDRISICDEGAGSGTLQDVLVRWAKMESLGDEALLGVTVSVPVRIAGWDAPLTHLFPEHLSQLAKQLDLTKN